MVVWGSRWYHQWTGAKLSVCPPKSWWCLGRSTTWILLLSEILAPCFFNHQKTSTVWGPRTLDYPNRGRSRRAGPFRPQRDHRGGGRSRSEGKCRRGGRGVGSSLEQGTVGRVVSPLRHVKTHGIFWSQGFLGDSWKTHQWYYPLYILLTVGISPYEGYIHPCLSPQFWGKKFMVKPWRMGSQWIGKLWKESPAWLWSPWSRSAIWVPNGSLTVRPWKITFPIGM